MSAKTIDFLSLTETKEIQALTSIQQVDWLLKNKPPAPKISKALADKIKQWETLKKSVCAKVIEENKNADKTIGLEVSGELATLKLKAAPATKVLKSDDPIAVIKKLGIDTCASALTLSASKLATALGTVNSEEYIKTNYGTRAFQSLKEI